MDMTGVIPSSCNQWEAGSSELHDRAEASGVRNQGTLFMSPRHLVEVAQAAMLFGTES